MSPRRVTVLWLLLTWWLLVQSASAQQPTIEYVYDALGRLIAVVDQDDNLAIYAYDAVGNILEIQRISLADFPDPVAIVLVSPDRGGVGTEVVILGKGFSADPLQNTVSFNGGLADVSAASVHRIVTSVPADAVTGPITVTTPLGSAASPTPFQVLGELAVAPDRVVLLPNITQQFTALEADTPTSSVLWTVDGVTGGNATVGTISPEGFYTPPTTPPAPPTVTVTATHTDDAALSASASVRILPAETLLAAPGVSIELAAPGIQVDKNVTTSVSVEVASAASFVTATAVAVTLEPVITGVSPASALAGTSNLSVSLTGAGFSGATGVSFLLNDVPDGDLTLASLVVNAEGTQATAEISIAPGAAVGARVVQIATPAGTSTAAGTGGNLFTVE